MKRPIRIVAECRLKLSAVLLAAALLVLSSVEAKAIRLFATDGTLLLNFDTVTTGGDGQTVVGLQPGETLVGIDFRPATGQLYGVGSTSRLYVINTTTATATQVGAAGQFTLNGTHFGVDFNPVTDQLRIVSDTRRNIRLNPNTGALIATDTLLNTSGEIVGLAYSRNFEGTSTTSLYGIDAEAGQLVRIGSFLDSPNNGNVTVIGSIGGSNFNRNLGFDIGPDGVAYAALITGGLSRLYTIDLATGDKTLVNLNADGTIGNGTRSFHSVTAVTGGTYINANPIYVPAPGTNGDPGGDTSNPYPSTITVSGLGTTQVAKVIVTIKDFRHPSPDDVDMLLVGPQGQKMVIWSEAGGENSTCGSNCNNAGNIGTQGVDIVLDDSAATRLPDSAALASGVFQPTNYGDGDLFPAPAPAGPYAEAEPTGTATFATTFNGTNPNGTWRLYVVDDAVFDSGRIADGWSLTIFVGTPCELNCPANITVPAASGQCGAVVSYPAITRSGNCTGTTTASPASGSFYPIGTTQVIADSSDGARCSFDVTVVDTEGPSISCAGNITAQAAPGENSAVVTFASPTVGDNCAGVIASTNPPSGATFPVGTTTVNATARDAAGNTAACSFLVTVEPSSTPTPTPAPAKVANISTRTRVNTGDNVLIGGFIITGSGEKTFMARAIGPSLPVAGALADPRLSIFNSSGDEIATNDNWPDAPNRQAIIDTSIAPANDLESAVLQAVPPGAYTAIVSGNNGASGIGLVEVYDLDQSAASSLANISTRGVVQTGDEVMIGGFIITGAATQKVIARAIGPSLAVDGKVVDPLLEVYNGSGELVGSNDNWRTTQEAEINATTIAPTDDLEAALVTTLGPGGYTVIVRGVNDTTGVALVEVYALQ